MGEATLGLDAERSSRGYTTQRKAVSRMPTAFEALVIGVISLVLCVVAEAHRIVIGLSEQRVYLLEGSEVLLCSPIASGKPGWNTPIGRFRISAKDIDHRSGSFGLIVNSKERVVNANATPGTRVPRGHHYDPAPMPYFMQFAPMVGLHAGYLPGYPASHGCVRMPRDFAAKFFAQVSIGTPVTVVGSTQKLSHVRKALPARPWRTVR